MSGDERALIITDVQYDFCPGGALPVKRGDEVIPVINHIAPRFDRIVATQDWHPRNHVSFASTHHRALYEVIKVDGLDQVLWPDHCVPGTRGAQFHRDLDTDSADLILRKGNDPAIDSYSVFFDNDRTSATGLQYYLQGLGVTEIFICGLATDYCVYYSAMDARRCGFTVNVILDATRGIDVPPGSLQAAIDDMRAGGVRITDHEHL
jgi:nicotinamidase/pyrazinamidase